MTQLAAPVASPKPTRVMIVDDSAVIRAVISKTLSGHSDINVVGIAGNGELAVKSVKIYDPDIVILDIEMPVMDGLTALPLLLKEKPGLKVVICSTLSARGADVTIRALSLGAADYILKPGADSIVSAADFQANLLNLVRSLSGRRSATVVSNGSTPTLLPTSSSIKIRKDHVLIPPQIIAIGSSTGGPKVLMEVLGKLKNINLPIVITQHMPKTFTALLADHIAQNCKIPCKEGAEGDVLQPGHAYVAPGGFHMVFKKTDAGTTVHLNEDPLENYCRPSVNPMLRSLIPIYGKRILSVILTGMGADGSQACADLVAQGGTVIAQDEATSAVWGMPGTVATAGICSAVLPPEQISEWINRAVRGV